jgi:PqqD family protein of HPr-rel-A system
VSDDATDSRIWSILEPEGLVWRCWDGEYIVFHPFSGMTHYLDATAGAVLELLLDRPASVRDLAIELESVADTPATAMMRAALQQVLRRFDDVGLAEPMP